MIVVYLFIDYWFIYLWFCLYCLKHGAIAPCLIPHVTLDRTSWSLKSTPCCGLHEIADHVSSQSKRKTTHFRGIFVWIILLLKHLYNNNFIINVFKHFSKTNSQSKATCPFNTYNHYKHKVSGGLANSTPKNEWDLSSNSI